MRRVQNYPPPGTYDPDYKAGIKSMPKWGFGSSKRGGLTTGKTVSPGMQTYSIPSRAVEGSKWEFGLKLESQGALSGSKMQAPPPGAYDPNYRASIKSDPSFSMKGRHAPSKSLNVPGPGTYSKNLADKRQAPSFGFGKGPQIDPLRKTISPGPGAYRVPSTVGNLPTYALPNQNDAFRYT